MSAHYTVRALSPMRKMIAARMSEAKQTIPHFRLVVEIEVDTLLAMRERMRCDSPHREVSLNDMLVKACATALMAVPAVNVQWVDGAIHQYHSADIAVVIAIEGGLTTPIICSADSKSVWEIAQEVQELARRAAQNALKMHEILGGSFSISNLGMYGVDQFDAIINPPQCAILAVGRAQSRIFVTEDGQTRVAKTLRATLSVDHRVIDGITGAAFLAALRRAVEQPDGVVAA